LITIKHSHFYVCEEVLYIKRLTLSNCEQLEGNRLRIVGHRVVAPRSALGEWGWRWQREVEPDR